jgi:hypothetical protein
MTICLLSLPHSPFSNETHSYDGVPYSSKIVELSCRSSFTVTRQYTSGLNIFRTKVVNTKKGPCARNKSIIG